jgi:hypothetical protein
VIKLNTTNPLILIIYAEKRIFCHCLLDVDLCTFCSESLPSALRSPIWDITVNKLMLICRRNLRERDQLDDINVDGRVILEWILKKFVERM